MIEPPRLVLEYMQKSARQARWQRTFTRKEIKWIMRWTLHSLIRIEAESLVNTHLCITNMSLNNHRDQVKDPRESPQLVPKLADFSHCLHPQRGVIGHPQYRAPEVHFGMPWAYPAHLTQLLEAQADFAAHGIYDTEEIQRCGADLSHHNAYNTALIHDFALDTVPHYKDLGLRRDKQMVLPRWSERLRTKGLREDDIGFVEWVLEPNPDIRPTSTQI
ncbi:hypothetical protein GTA08_BOTSDO11936 [Botryosphaeria dothidea]|uniref:Protein kinase domain-containing protein n=1 Tax=Botryosphaeria dothidea TaxID=55169 RepID=A0A8H4J4N0_9PEZI|nr:hypothetical protein GTA08_BOTSDO11936 [Botryosphaeria dothidea]